MAVRFRIQSKLRLAAIPGLHLTGEPAGGDPRVGMSVQWPGAASPARVVMATKLAAQPGNSWSIRVVPVGPHDERLFELGCQAGVVIELWD